MLNGIVPEWALDQHICILDQKADQPPGFVGIVLELGHQLLEHTQAVGVVPELDDIFSYWFIDKVQVLGIEAENNLLNEVCSVIVL